MIGENMDTKTWFRKKLDLFKDDFDFRLEKIILNITEKISERMIQKKLNRSSFARVLNVSPPAVTKIFNGTDNFSLRRLLAMADALDLDLQINLVEKEAKIVKSTVYAAGTFTFPVERPVFSYSGISITTSGSGITPSIAAEGEQPFGSLLCNI